MPGSSALAASRQSVRHILVDGFWPVPPRCKSYHENRLRYPPAAGIWRQTLVAEGCSSRPFPSSPYRCTRRVCSWDCSCPCPVHLRTRNRSCRRRQRSTGYDLMGATNMPAPKSRRRRVAEIGARLDPAQPLSSQRSNTQTWSSGSTLDVVRGRSRTRHVSPLHSRNDRGWMPPLRNKPLALVASRSIRSRPRGPLPVSFVCSSWSS